MSSEAISAPAQQPVIAPEPAQTIHTTNFTTDDDLNLNLNVPVNDTDIGNPSEKTESQSQPQPQSPTSTGGLHDAATADHVECAKPTFLHSPPDSNDAAKSEGSDSELSDLDESAIDPKLHDEEPKAEEEDVDIGEVEPDHWSGQVPVFRPTMYQFKDFKKFMEKIDGYGMRSGIVKIIPPQEWKDSLPKLDDLVKQVRVRDPIKQDIMGSNGTYRQVNIVHQRAYNVPQWRKLCDQSEHQPPARRGERRANADKPRPATRTRSAAAASTPKPATTAAKKRASGRKGKKKGGRGRPKREEEPEDRPLTPESPRATEEEAVKEEPVQSSVEKEDPGMDVDEDDEPRPAGRMGRMGGARATKDATQSVSARRKFSRREGSAMIDEEAFKDFDYQMDISEYTPERCEELERVYWKTLTYATPLYGADLMGTLFEESTETWNLNKLPNLLDVLGTKVPGVNTAYLYLGMWKATFAWHLEDVDLYSINYLHFGAPKQWYSIAQADLPRFEAAMKNIWPTDAKSCNQFLRHKGFLISPHHLKQHYNITVNKCVSYPGEFVVTYPYGYHSGYNLGYNCAEAVNFALDSWLPMGKVAKRCECAQAQDSVWVDVYDIERRLRGEETEYEETDEEEDEDEDMEDESGIPSPTASHTVKIKIPPRKRKRGPKDKDGKQKVKKVRLRVKARPEPVCCLCPNDPADAEILPTDDGRKAHRKCALYLPETYIDTVDEEEVVANVANISKERQDLKCLFCRSKRGACLQCSHKKCARAYHATCAVAAGMFVEEAEVPVFGEDGTEYKEQAFEFSCRFHRTRRDKKVDGDALEEDPKIREAAETLQKGDVCQLQYHRGDIFAGTVVENRVSEQTFLVDVIPNGDQVEVEWKWLLLPDAADYRLPKASAKAIPMPSSRKAQDQLNAKRVLEDIPRKDEVFVEGGFTWAEFNTCEPPKNKEQAKADLAKDCQVWYYLGNKSTDARPQYTESPALPRHNPRSNYLDTIPKPPKAPKPAKVRASAHPQPRTSFVPHVPSPLANSTSTANATPSVAPPSAAAPSVAAPAAALVKAEKPYVYKPRKPVQPTWTGQSQFYTSQQFSVSQAPPQQPLSQQQQQYQWNVAPRPQEQGVQNTQSVQNTQAAQFTQQRFTPSYSQNSTFASPYASAPTANQTQVPQQVQWSTQAYTPPQQQQIQQRPAQNQYQTQAIAQANPGTQYRFANQTANQTTTNQRTLAPQTPTVPQTSTAQKPAAQKKAASNQAAARQQTQPRPASANHAQHVPSVYQKYPFFRALHNRDSSQYRTPYVPSTLGGGFTNGYEGNFRAHLLQTTAAALQSHGRPGSTSNPFSYSAQSFAASTIAQAPSTPNTTNAPQYNQGLSAMPPAYTNAVTGQHSTPIVPQTGNSVAIAGNNGSLMTPQGPVAMTYSQPGNMKQEPHPPSGRSAAPVPQYTAASNPPLSQSTVATPETIGPNAPATPAPTATSPNPGSDDKNSSASKAAAPKAQYKVVRFQSRLTQQDFNSTTNTSSSSDTRERNPRSLTRRLPSGNEKGSRACDTDTDPDPDVSAENEPGAGKEARASEHRATPARYPLLTFVFDERCPDYDALRNARHCAARSTAAIVQGTSGFRDSRPYPTTTFEIYGPATQSFVASRFSQGYPPTLYGVNSDPFTFGPVVPNPAGNPSPFTPHAWQGGPFFPSGYVQPFYTPAWNGVFPAWTGDGGGGGGDGTEFGMFGPAGCAPGFNGPR